MAGREAGDVRPEHDDPDAVLIRLLRQLNVETDRFAEMFGEAHGLYRTDLNALVVIMDAMHGADSISPGELARALQLSASATTAVLDRLEKAGHVKRSRSANDGRRIELRLPEATLRLGEERFRLLGADLRRAWSGFDTGERDTIARFLTASIRATTTVRTRLSDSADEPHGAEDQHGPEEPRSPEDQHGLEEPHGADQAYERGRAREVHGWT